MSERSSRTRRRAGLERSTRVSSSWALVVLAGLLVGCSSVSAPNGVRPVRGFDVQRYLGKWYEIARLDHRFERGLESVSAEYSIRSNGTIKVVNRGYDSDAGKWKVAQGVAKFIGDPTTGSLKVSFFRPFYGGYHVFALDEADYTYAMVCGPSKEYLWILAREKTLGGEILAELLSRADRSGFETNALIYVDHGPRPVTE